MAARRAGSPATATATTASTAATPCVTTLLEIARELGVAGDYCALASEIESVLKKKKAMVLCLNVDGVIVRSRRH